MLRHRELVLTVLALALLGLFVTLSVTHQLNDRTLTYAALAVTVLALVDNHFLHHRTDRNVTESNEKLLEDIRQEVRKQAGTRTQPEGAPEIASRESQAAEEWLIKCLTESTSLEGLKAEDLILTSRQRSKAESLTNAFRVPALVVALQALAAREAIQWDGTPGGIVVVNK